MRVYDVLWCSAWQLELVFSAHFCICGSILFFRFTCVSYCAGNASELCISEQKQVIESGSSIALWMRKQICSQKGKIWFSFWSRLLWSQNEFSFFRHPIFIQCFRFHVYFSGRVQTNCEFFDKEVVLFSLEGNLAIICNNYISTVQKGLPNIEVESITIKINIYAHISLILCFAGTSCTDVNKSTVFCSVTKDIKYKVMLVITYYGSDICAIALLTRSYVP